MLAQMKNILSISVTTALLVLANGCDAGPNPAIDSMPEPETNLLIKVKPLFMVLRPWSGEDGWYLADTRFSITFTNRTDTTLYLPLCGGGIPSPVYQRLAGNEWQDAIVVAETSIGCDESLAIKSGETYADSTWLGFPVTPGSLPFFGNTPKIEDVYGTFRLRFDVYTAFWSAEPIPLDALLPEDSRVSNDVELRAPG